MNKRLKILWLSHLIPYPPKGGALQRAHNLINNLSRHHDVYVLAFKRPGVYEQLFASAEAGIAEAETWMKSVCIDFEHLPIPCDQQWAGQFRLLLKGYFSSDGYSISWLKSREMKQKIVEWTNATQFDVVHFDTISLVQFKKYMPAIPCTLDHHNIESDMLLLRAQNEKNVLKKYYFRQEGKKLQQYERIHCPGFDMNFTCSDIDAGKLDDICKCPAIVTIPNMVDVEYFSPLKLEQETNSLVFAGGLSWYPNMDAMSYLADEIWPVLKRNIPNITMNLVGKNPAQQLIDLSKTDPDFKVHGFVDDVRPYLARSMVYICPIREGGGTRLKILDALSMGCPIVAHPKAIEGIDLKDGESVLVASTPGEFCEKVSLLMKNEKLRKTLSVAGRDIVLQNYSSEAVGIKLSESFKQLTRSEG